jgi:hypothetical protein
VVQVALGEASWSKFLDKNKFSNFFLGKEVFENNNHSTNPMVPLDFKALSLGKSYGPLKGWLTPFDLAMTSLTNKWWYKKEDKQIPRKITSEVVLFGQYILRVVMKSTTTINVANNISEAWDGFKL